mmetsp:Transcript_177874/g.570548  ORF Transcript_177874/g.570548 Transcript_177874/m.570548 type:complete len:231 (+) Transcript_177874:1183-1875(+)
MTIEGAGQSVAVVEVGQREIVLVRGRVPEPLGALLARDDRGRIQWNRAIANSLSLIAMRLPLRHHAMLVALDLILEDIQKSLIWDDGEDNSGRATAESGLQCLLQALQLGQGFCTESGVATPGARGRQGLRALPRPHLRDVGGLRPAAHRHREASVRPAAIEHSLVDVNTASVPGACRFETIHHQLSLLLVGGRILLVRLEAGRQHALRHGERPNVRQFGSRVSEQQNFS